MGEHTKGGPGFKALFDGISALIGLATAGVAFLAAMRNDPRSYVVTISMLTAGVILILSIQTILPENRARYARYHWLAFCGLGFVLGVLLSFAAFSPNREYVQAAFVNSPTPSATQTPSPTLTSTATATPTPSAEPATPTPTPTPTATEELPSPTPSLTPTSSATATPTPTPVLILSETFLDNSYGWIESDPVERPGEAAVWSRVIGGSYKQKIACPADALRGCTVLIAIPNVTIRDFRLDYDVTITSVTNYANAATGVFFRFDQNSYYGAHLYKNGFYDLQLVKQGRQDDLASYAYNLHINRDLNAANHVEISAKGSSISYAVNDILLAQAEDGNIDQTGKIYFSVTLPADSSVAVEFDNVELFQIP